MSDKKSDIILDATKDGAMVQFNLNDVKGQIADQMRAFLLNMMPASAFDQVIEVAFKKLTEPRPPEKDKWGNQKHPERPSELEEMVTKEMRARLQEKVVEWSKGWKDTAEADRARDDLMKELIDRAASGFVHRVASQIVTEALVGVASATNTMMCSSCNRIVAKNQSCPDCGAYNC